MHGSAILALRTGARRGTAADAARRAPAGQVRWAWKRPAATGATGLMAVSMMLGATRIGDMISHGGHSRTDIPLLQFARHYRNACAHGDRWEFRGTEPKTEATCRHLTLTAALYGQRATYSTVSPRLHVEFLDDIANYFSPGSVPPPARET